MEWGRFLSGICLHAGWSVGRFRAAWGSGLRWATNLVARGGVALGPTVQFFAREPLWVRTCSCGCLARFAARRYCLLDFEICKTGRPEVPAEGPEDPADGTRRYLYAGHRVLEVRDVQDLSALIKRNFWSPEGLDTILRTDVADTAGGLRTGTLTTYLLHHGPPGLASRGRRA